MLSLLIAIDVIIQYTKLEIQIYIFFHSLKSEWLPTIFFQKVLPVCVKDREKSLFEGKKKFSENFLYLFATSCSYDCFVSSHSS
jgi:hypothetical protein